MLFRRHDILVHLEDIFLCLKRDCGLRRRLSLAPLYPIFWGTATWNGGVRAASKRETGRDPGRNV